MILLLRRNGLNLIKVEGWWIVSGGAGNTEVFLTFEEASAYLEEVA
jgi:hypothetical protein